MRRSLLAGIGVLTILGALAGVAWAADVKVTLSGSQEVPVVTTDASGGGTITVADDKAVSGSITTSGITGTAAHIHEAAAGKNGNLYVNVHSAAHKDGEIRGQLKP